MGNDLITDVISVTLIVHYIEDPKAREKAFQMVDARLYKDKIRVYGL